jgi:hypothetical protein
MFPNLSEIKEQIASWSPLVKLAFWIALVFAIPTAVYFAMWALGSWLNVLEDRGYF